VALVSISGGRRDVLVWPELSDIVGIADSPPAMAVATRDIPSVGCEVDHLVRAADDDAGTPRRLCLYVSTWAYV
jgi:hypothetical protein